MILLCDRCAKWCVVVLYKNRANLSGDYNGFITNVRDNYGHFSFLPDSQTCSTMIPVAV